MDLRGEERVGNALISRGGISIGVSFGFFACGGVGSIGLGYFQEGAVIVLIAVVGLGLGP